MRGKSVLLAAAGLALSSLASAPGAEAAGCLKGAVVGGVAGHMVHHGVLGAAAGCAIGHHEASKHERERERDAAEARNAHDDPDRR
jgi:hypothetical protein